jgi:thiol-disulfide isomerase/thioredoxin
MHRCRFLPYVLAAHLSLSFFLCATGARADPFTELANRRRLEVTLLHLPIDRVALGSLPVWDDKTKKLRLRVPGEVFDDTRPILILHLWATWCAPCKEEFGVWKELKERMQKQFGYDVGIVHIAMQTDAAGMPSFVRQVGDDMPVGPKFFDRDERLSHILRGALKGKEIPTLPLTLWLGPPRNVRQVMAGAIGNRTAEVLESTDRLLQSIRTLRDDMKKDIPREVEWDTFTRTGPCACPCVCN